MNGIKVISTGYYSPKKVVSNKDFEKTLDTSDEWIVSRTGIKNRRFVEDETTDEIGYLAAKNAIEKTNIDTSKIGIIIVATITPENFTPSAACLIQEKLGLNNQEVMAFDINAACSGFVYGLSIARSLLNTLPGKYALIIGSETLSNILDMEDRTTCVLFGDGAGALLVESSDQLFVSYNDSKGEKDVLFASAKNYGPLQMKGQEVFKFALRTMPKAIKRVLLDANLTIDDIDYVVCHQANQRIISSVYTKNKWDENKFYMNLSEYGNTSGASIPLALAQMDEEGLLKPKMKIICVGFGGGLTWGATLFEW